MPECLFGHMTGFFLLPGKLWLRAGRDKEIMDLWRRKVLPLRGWQELQANQRKKWQVREQPQEHCRWSKQQRRRLSCWVQKYVSKGHALPLRLILSWVKGLCLQKPFGQNPCAKRLSQAQQHRGVHFIRSDSVSCGQCWKCLPFCSGPITAVNNEYKTCRHKTGPCKSCPKGAQSRDHDCSNPHTAWNMSAWASRWLYKPEFPKEHLWGALMAGGMF